MKKDIKLDDEVIEIGKRIKEARISFDNGKGMTQKQLGELCGINEANIRKYESGRQRPKYSTLEKIGKALNVAPSYLQGANSKIIHALRTLNEMGELNTGIRNGKIFEKYLGLEPDLILPLSEEEKTVLDEKVQVIRSIKTINIKRISLFLSVCYDKFTDTDYDVLCSLIKAFTSMNDKGQQKAIEQVEDLAKIPDYQKNKTPSEGE